MTSRLRCFESCLCAVAHDAKPIDIINSPHLVMIAQSILMLPSSWNKILQNTLGYFWTANKELRVVMRCIDNIDHQGQCFRRI